MPRSTASGRSTATNRVAVQDIKSSLSFNGTSSLATVPVAPATTGFNFAFWTKVNKAVTNDRIIDYSDAGPSGGFNVVITSNGTINFTVWNGGAASAAVPSLATLKRNEWVHIVGTYIPDNANLYINSVWQAVDGLCQMSTPSVSLTLGRRASSASNYFGGNISQFVFQNTTTPWTQKQITALYQNGTIPSGATCVLPLQEGAGTTAYDSSGNGNHGTITSGTFTSDVPTKKRELVGGNLVKNGNFEFVPPFTAATTTNARYIDGTAAGSTTNNLFGWAINGVSSGTNAVRYETVDAYSTLKLSTTATNSNCDVSTNVNFNAAGFKMNVPVLPSTSYTGTFRMKTNYVSGDSDDGAFVIFQEATATGTATSNISSKVKTTTGWTTYTVIFTTGSTTRYVVPRLIIKGTTGAATLVMDAWLDDIELRPTTPVPRGIA